MSRCERCPAEGTVKIVTRFGWETVCKDCRAAVEKDSLICVFVKANSHRARDKLRGLLIESQCYYDWDRPSTGGYFLVAEARLADARKIKGVTKAKHPEDLRRCIN